MTSSGLPNSVLRSLLFRIAMAFFVVFSAKSTSIYVASLLARGPACLKNMGEGSTRPGGPKIRSNTHDDSPEPSVAACTQAYDLALTPLLGRELEPPVHKLIYSFGSYICPDINKGWPRWLQVRSARKEVSHEQVRDVAFLDRRKSSKRGIRVCLSYSFIAIRVHIMHTT